MEILLYSLIILINLFSAIIGGGFIISRFFSISMQAGTLIFIIIDLIILIGVIILNAKNSIEFKED